MVPNGKADLILALEALEGLRELSKAGKQTKTLINEYFLPFIGSLPKEEIMKQLGNTKKSFYLVPASKECKDKLQNEVVCTLYLLGYAVFNGFMPLKPGSVLSAIDKIVPQKYLELNKKAFLLAKNNG